MLQECGLTENQARVYLALLDHPGGTVSGLSKAAELPRNRLYEMLEELNAIGLVDIVLDEPRRYRARSIDTFVTRCKTELQTRIEQLEARRPHLIAAFQPRDAVSSEDHERGTTQVLTGRRAVAQEIERMLAEARREIVLAGSVGGSLRLAKHLMEARPLREGVVIEYHVPIASAEQGGWENFVEAGIGEVSWVDAQRATMVVITDREEMLRIHPLPDDERTHVGQDFALLTNNAAIIHDELLGLRHLPRAIRLKGPSPRE